jgi:type IV pilus assembly protein PilN
MAWGTQWPQRQGAPRIDLLPRQVIEQRLVRRQRGGMGAALLLLLVVLGLWYMLEARELAEAERQADQEQATAAGLRARRAQLQPLADLEAQIAAADQLRTQVYAREIRFSTVMRDIAAVVPDDVWLTSMAAAFNEGSAAPAAAAGGGAAAPTGAAEATTPGSPGAGSPVASITFAGAGLGHPDVGGLLRALADAPRKGGRPVYLNPYFTSSQRGDDSGQPTVTFSATVDLSDAAYSGRYQPQQPGTVAP